MSRLFKTGHDAFVLVQGVLVQGMPPKCVNPSIMAAQGLLLDLTQNGFTNRSVTAILSKLSQAAF